MEMISTALLKILSGREFLQSGQKMSLELIKVSFCSERVNFGVELSINSAVFVSQSSPLSSKSFCISEGFWHWEISF